LVACLTLVTPAGFQRTLLLSAGVLGAVAGSRLLARGGALGAARRAATWSVVPAVGRMAGALILIGPVLLLVCLGRTPEDQRVGAALLVSLLFGAVQVTLAMALSPAVGASAAAAVGLLAAFADGAGPRDGWVLAACLVGGLWAAAFAMERFPETGSRGE